MKKVYFDTSALISLYKYRGEIDVSKITNNFHVVTSIYNIAELSAYQNKVERQKQIAFCSELMQGYLPLDMPHDLLERSFVGFMKDDTTFIPTIKEERNAIYQLICEAPLEDENYQVLAELKKMTIDDFRKMHIDFRPLVQEIILTDSINPKLASLTREMCTSRSTLIKNFINKYIEANIPEYQSCPIDTNAVFSKLEPWRFL